MKNKNENHWKVKAAKECPTIVGGVQAELT
jgi:hypothetical protein